MINRTDAPDIVEGASQDVQRLDRISKLLKDLVREIHAQDPDWTVKLSHWFNVKVFHTSPPDLTAAMYHVLKYMRLLGIVNYQSRAPRPHDLQDQLGTADRVRLIFQYASMMRMDRLNDALVAVRRDNTQDAGRAKGFPYSNGWYKPHTLEVDLFTKVAEAKSGAQQEPPVYREFM